MREQPVSVFDPIKCEKCGNDDQDTIRSEPSPNIHKRIEAHGRQIVTLLGWRCDKCGHVTPEPKHYSEEHLACR